LKDLLIENDIFRVTDANYFISSKNALFF